MGKIADQYKKSHANNREVTMPLCHFIPKRSSNLTPKDRQNIRLVLEHLGVPATMGNYRKYASIIDFEQFAYNIQNPNFDVLCNIVHCGQAVGRIFVNVKAPDRAAAREKIKNNFVEFSSYEPVPE